MRQLKCLSRDNTDIVWTLVCLGRVCTCIQGGHHNNTVLCKLCGRLNCADGQVSLQQHNCTRYIIAAMYMAKLKFV
jgi:hypothetical protein